MNCNRFVVQSKLLKAQIFFLHFNEVLQPTTMVHNFFHSGNALHHKQAFEEFLYDSRTSLLHTKVFFVETLDPDN